METARTSDAPPTEQGSTLARFTERADRLGIDLGLLQENLRLTPTERMRQHDHCVRQLLATQERLGVRNDDQS